MATKVCALAGTNLQEGASFGDDALAALEDLVKTIRPEDTTIWVPRRARQFREGERVKCACPECGHIRDLGEFTTTIAYVCENCGEGVDVEPSLE